MFLWKSSGKSPAARSAAADFSLAMLCRGKEKLKGGEKLRAISCQWRRTPMPCPLGRPVSTPLPLPSVSATCRTDYGFKGNAPGLRPGGMVAILEFIPPESGWLQNLYKLYLNRLLPLVGRIFSHHTFAYSYLAESISNFPTAEAFCRQMQEAGFRQVQMRALTFGVVCLFYGEKGAWRHGGPPDRSRHKAEIIGRNNAF